MKSRPSSSSLSISADDRRRLVFTSVILLSLPLFYHVVFASTPRQRNVPLSTVTASPTLAIHDVRLAPAGSSCIPEQLHLSLGDVPSTMRITWMVRDTSIHASRVWFGDSASNVQSAHVDAFNFTSYATKDGLYKSGNIFSVVLGPLSPRSTYAYRITTNDSCGTDIYSFRVPPPKANAYPVTLSIVGDIGQTENSITTIRRIQDVNPDAVLIPGDLSYADCDHERWNSWGRMTEALFRKNPMITAHGNHEIEACYQNLPNFAAYTLRYHPDDAQPHYYSRDIGPVHIVVLGSYIDYSPSSPQRAWAEGDLAAVDRTVTPWVIVILHAPWYSSNLAHAGEREMVGMRDEWESLLYQYRVDMLFAGHVHAYERSHAVKPGGVLDACGIVHIVIGDGGNREGLAFSYLSPQPAWSAYREASYGAASLQVLNATHAMLRWQRNADPVGTLAEAVYIARDRSSCGNFGQGAMTWEQWEAKRAPPVEIESTGWSIWSQLSRKFLRPGAIG